MIPLGDGRRLPVPFMVYALIALNVYVFVHELTAPDRDAYINALAAIPFDITRGITLPPPSPPLPLLTLLTAMFVHAGFAHIFFNLLFLLVFGPGIEYLCGHLRFLGLYVACGLAGWAAMISSDPSSHVPEIGASGAIAGILGAYIVNFPRANINAIVPIGCLPVLLRIPVFALIGLWAAAQFLHGFGALADKVGDAGGTAYFAHIGGFCAGVLLIGVFKIRSPRARGRRSYW